MTTPPENVVRLPDGSIGLRLVPRERAILRALVGDLRATIGETPVPGMVEVDAEPGDAGDRPIAESADEPSDHDTGLADEATDVDDELADAGADSGVAGADVDPVLRRLYPDARPDDPAASARFRAMIRADLDDDRRDHLDVVEATLDARAIDDAQAESWLLVLNDLRLVMGTRLEVTDETEAEDFDPEAPDAAAKIVYAYTGWLEGQFIDVLAAALPPVPGDDTDPDEGLAQDDS